WIVGKTDRFRAAAAQKPVINWTSEVLTVDMYSFMARYWFGKMPWEDPQAYWARSPLSLVGNVKTQWSSTSRMRGLRRRNLNSSIRHATPRRPITPDGCNEIAKRCRGALRVANRLRKRTRDFAEVKGTGEITASIACDALKLLDVDEHG